ncbi:lysozyme inhibitor LprI family protein [Acinetobacter gerneri]
MMKTIIHTSTLFFSCLFSLAFATASHAASFNCAAAKTVTEHTICDTRSLNDADVKMATTYNIVRHLVPMGTRSIIQDQQIKWLKLRDDCRDSVSCLTDVYKMQQQRLDKYMSRIYQQGPF